MLVGSLARFVSAQPVELRQGLVGRQAVGQVVVRIAAVPATIYPLSGLACPGSGIMTLRKRCLPTQKPEAKPMSSPKQPQPESQRDWYPYYAGFTQGFASEVLARHVCDTNPILDPWNGSGTTTAACARNGLAAIGVDINPTLTVIARARLTPLSVAASLFPLGAEILEAAQRQPADSEHDDLLNVWLRRKAVSGLRSIQVAIHTILSDVPDWKRTHKITDLADSLPLLACFYYSALFATTRDLLHEFRATNPTWTKQPLKTRNKVAPGWKAIGDQFLDRVNYFAKRLSIDGHPQNNSASVHTGSALNLPFETGMFGASVTSPPYATRIDYVKSTLPELAVLGARKMDIDNLRRKSTGTPVVKGVKADPTELSSPHGRFVLKSIESHPSKGSKGYYLPWMANYFKGLQRGLNEVARVVATNGQICVIVQDSHYKEIHIDLQRFVIEAMGSAGRNLKMRQDYKARHHRARMNPRARRHLSTRHNVESLLIFT